LINESRLDELDSQLDLSTFLQQHGFSDHFINGFLYPLWALICTCDYQNLDRFPVRDMLVILRNFSGRAPSLRIKGGTASFEEKMKQRIATPKFSESVQQISTALSNDQVQIKTDKGDYHFDHVIVATEPYFAAKMLDQSFARERALIADIPWYETTMVLHKDLDLMPKKRSMWSPVNLFWDPEQRRSWATLWMNQLEISNPQPEALLQSWDPGVPPKDDTILATRTFKRVLATKKSQKIVKELNHAMSSEPQRRLWFVGAYMTDNIPLLENGVATARQVAEWITWQTTQAAEPYSKRNAKQAKAVNR
jgi:predicted NAD/FAD-binding protein